MISSRPGFRKISVIFLLIFSQTCSKHPFTPEIREELLETPPERLIRTCETLIAQHGQRIQDAAEIAYAAGKIARDKYLAILAERKNPAKESQS